jgi:hypothetical protein
MKKYNSNKRILEVLLKNPCITEDKIFEKAFNYFRYESFESNKKYADMLRRLYYKGIIDRMDVKKNNIKIDNKSQYLYYIKNN